MLFSKSWVDFFLQRHHVDRYLIQVLSKVINILKSFWFLQVSVLSKGFSEHPLSFVFKIFLFWDICLHWRSWVTYQRFFFSDQFGSRSGCKLFVLSELEQLILQRFVVHFSLFINHLPIFSRKNLLVFDAFDHLFILHEVIFCFGFFVIDSLKVEFVENYFLSNQRICVLILLVDKTHHWRHLSSVELFLNHV